MENRVIAALQCMIFLEEAVAEFYDRLASVLKRKNAAAALIFVARESRNHAQLLESLFGRPSNVQCTSELGTAGASMMNKLRELAAKLDGGWVPSDEQAADLLEELNDLERFAGEEVYTQVAAAALSVHLTHLEKTLLSTIAEEERKHYEIIRRVIGELRAAGEEA
ncbi:MAG: hypothetical protein QXU72_07140 [Thermofilum sp.]